MLRIGFVSEFDPLTRKSWSGTHYTLFSMLKQQYDVRWINSDPLQIKAAFKAWMRIKRMMGKNYDWMHAVSYSKYLCRNVMRQLKEERFDLLYAPAGSGSIAFLETDTPIIYHSDSTFRLAHDYNRDFSNLSKHNLEGGELLERLALKKATKIILASSWAKRSAIDDYEIESGKIATIPFVPNLEKVPCDTEIRYEKSESLNLLFVGTNWRRKGGPTVLRIYRILKQRYPHCRLTIVGDSPDSRTDNPDINICGFLDKKDPVQRQRLYSIYLGTDFFILPTQFDAAGIVFCEASSFGVPCLTFDTGGTGEYVENKINGFTFPPGAAESEFADAIASVYDDPIRFKSLRESTRRKYEKEFTRDRWLDRFGQLLEGAEIV